MDHPSTFYDVLGIPETAGIEEIKHAHRVLAQQNHPDKLHHLAGEFPWVVEEAAERFKRINEAFHVLSDDAARRRYDEDLRRGRPHATPPRTPRSYSRPSGHAPKTGNRSTPTAEAARRTPLEQHRAAQKPPRAAADPHAPFVRYPIPPRPASGTEPTAEPKRRNIFASTFAFSAMICVICAAIHYGLPDEAHALGTIESTFGRSGSTPPDAAPANTANQNEDVRYLRTVFTAYRLAKTINAAAPMHQQEFTLLGKWGDAYYDSKFVVVSLEKTPSGASAINLLFRDQPDRIFKALVHKRGNGVPELRQFEALPATPQEIAAYRTQLAALPNDEKSPN